MKKFLGIIALAAVVSCNNSENKAAAESDSTRAKSTSDSLADIKKLADTLRIPVDKTAVKTMDSSIKALPKDSLK